DLPFSAEEPPEEAFLDGFGEPALPPSARTTPEGQAANLAMLRGLLDGAGSAADSGGSIAEGGDASSAPSGITEEASPGDAVDEGAHSASRNSGAASGTGADPQDPAPAGDAPGDGAVSARSGDVSRAPAATGGDDA